MKKRLCFGLGCLGLLMFLSRLFFFGFEVGIQDAWAQARTVLYKDFQQTVTVAHVFNNVAPAAPPFTVTGNSSGVPATGLAPDRIGLTTVLGLPVAGTSGRVRRLTDGGAVGAIVVDDGTNWTCGEAKSQKMTIATCPPYNAKGDGTTDDTIAIQSAITAGTHIYLPPGTYVLGDGDTADFVSLALTDGKTLRGAGVGATTLLLKNDGNSHMINAPDVKNVTIRDLTINGNRANQTVTTVHGIRGPGVRNLHINNVELIDIAHYGIGLDSSATNDLEDVFIDNVRLVNCGGDCINLHANGPGHVVERINISNISITNPGAKGLSDAGIDVRGRVQMNNIHVDGVTGATPAIRFRPTVIAGEEGGKRSSLSNFYLAGDPSVGSYGIYLDDEEVNISDGIIQGFETGVRIPANSVVYNPAVRITLSNVYARQAAVNGFLFQEEGTSCVNCRAFLSGVNGFTVDGDNVSLVNCQADSSTARGISVTANALYTSCVNCRVIGNTTEGIRVDGDFAMFVNTLATGNLGGGVAISGTSDGTVMQGGNIFGNTGTDVAASFSTNTILANLRGYITENKGTATIANGTTSIAVTHGVSFAPTTNQIRVTPTNNQGNASHFWISNAGATQFTINSDADPGATTATYAWQVSWN